MLIDFDMMMWKFPKSWGVPRPVSSAAQDVRGPAAPLPLTPRPPAEGPEGRSARRRHAGAGATGATAPMEERKVATSATDAFGNWSKAEASVGA